MRIFLHFAIFTVALAFFAQDVRADGHSMKIQSLVAGTGSVWKNQSGSVAVLTFTTSPTQPSTWDVSGYYVNNAQGTGCIGTPYPLTGVYYGGSNPPMISFSVAWSNASSVCNSSTGWTGYQTSNGTDVQFMTAWNLAYQGSSGGAILAGEDIFTLQQNPSLEKLVTE